MKTNPLLILAATVGTLSPSARGDDFPGESFSLRLPAALTHFSSYADVAAKGGASAASKWGSSINPAAIAWSFPKSYDVGISGQYSQIAFDEGTRLNFFTEVATIDAHDFGTFRFAMSEVRANDHASRLARLNFDYDVNFARVDWARRFGEKLGVGAGFSFSQSETTFHDAQFSSDTAKNTFTGHLGALWQPADRWLAGIVGDYAYGPSDTTTTFRSPFFRAHSESGDVAHQFTLQPGIAYEFRENALVHLDYQFGWFSNDSGAFTEQRVAAGTDIPLARFLYLRAGAAIDWRRNFAWTTGLGFYPRKGLYLDLAYQNDMFPEVQREFGHSHTINASVSWQF